uniref:Uncharacterized protein n=1 Tax=Lotharella globosa TaxID=91324 RepID=A0A7S3Z660_9EUKA
MLFCGRYLDHVMEVSARKPGTTAAAASAKTGRPNAKDNHKQEHKHHHTQLGIDEKVEQLGKKESVEQDEEGEEETRQVKRYQLESKVENLIKQAKVASFKEICARVGVRSREEIGVVLEKLQMDAMIVQGNWVVRSGYENYSKEERRQALARTYLMCLFQRNRIIDKKQVVQILKLDYESTRRILTDLSTCVGKGKWEFRKKTDIEFIEHYPDIVKEHAKKIAELEKNMLKILAG